MSHSRRTQGVCSIFCDICWCSLFNPLLVCINSEKGTRQLKGHDGARPGRIRENAKTRYAFVLFSRV